MQEPDRLSKDSFSADCIFEDGKYITEKRPCQDGPPGYNSLPCVPVKSVAENLLWAIPSPAAVWPKKPAVLVRKSPASPVADSSLISSASRSVSLMERSAASRYAPAVFRPTRSPRPFPSRKPLLRFQLKIIFLSMQRRLVL